MTKVLRYSAALLFVTALSLLVGGSAAAQSTNNPRYRQFRDTAAASITTPAAGNVRLFFDDDGFYWKNSAGTVTPVGSSISGLTAGVIPQAGSATSLVNSKMTASGTNGGTWTLYDDTAVTGVTQLAVRAGAGQGSAPLLTLASGGGANSGIGLIASTASNVLTIRTADDGQYANVICARFLSASGSMSVSGEENHLLFGYAVPIIWSSSAIAQLANADTGLARSAAGILKVTNGSTGQGGIGIADSATNSVSDALILRHQGGTVAGNGFGTGLLFQGENDAGVMHNMASIDAVYVNAADTAEHTQLVFSAYVNGAEYEIFTIDPYHSSVWGRALLFPTSGRVGSTAGEMQITGATDLVFGEQGVAWRWRIPETTGHFVPETTNTYDIGTSSAIVKDIYAGGLAVSDAATNTVTGAITLRHATSGTATTGFGTGLLFQGEDGAGNMQDMASIDAVYTDATNGSEDAKLEFYTASAGTPILAATLIGVNGGVYSFTFGASSTGLVRAGGPLRLSGDGIQFETHAGTGNWQITGTTGHLAPNTTNVKDIGTTTQFVRDSYLGTSIQGTRTQAISDNAAAATFVTIAVPTSDTTVGGRIFYTITAIDAGTAIQTKTGTYSFGLNNIGGTVTGNGTDVLEHSQLSTGTLAPTFSVNISGTNAQFQLVLDTSLDAAAETLKIEYRVQIDSGTATVTPAT